MSAEAPRPWTVRAYRPGDEKPLVELFARVFGRRISEAQWLWKLGTRASQVPNVFLAVVPDGDRDRPIFQYAGIPVRYRGPQGEVSAMVSVDTMTDPDFRRRGLLTEVGQYAYDRWREAGISFVIGLPNEQWGSRASALGWREVSRLEWRVRVLRPERIVARRLGIPLLGHLAPVGAVWNHLWRWRAGTDPSVAVRRLVPGGDGLGRLWSRLGSGRGSYSLLRDDDWVRWRYADAPGDSHVVWLAERAGEPVGYCVANRRTTDGRHVGYLPELITVGGDAATAGVLVQAAVAGLMDAGAEWVAALSTPGSPLDETLRRAGFLSSWGRFVVQIVPLQASLPPAPWDVAGGDFDVI